jgi:hypothetical protein
LFSSFFLFFFLFDMWGTWIFYFVLLSYSFFISPRTLICIVPTSSPMLRRLLVPEKRGSGVKVCTESGPSRRKLRPCTKLQSRPTSLISLSSKMTYII